ncbi:MAG: hypothetical protein JW969_00815 [Spirochaetales bacterium]|nr:hypothetical protein [Spirochaetales bacterium]
MYSKRREIAFHVIEILFSAIILAWFFLPLIIKDLFIVHPLNIYSTTFGLISKDSLIISILSYVVYLIPLICVLKIAAPFLKKLVPIVFSMESFIGLGLNFLNSLLIIGTILYFILQDANKLDYFFKIDVYVYGIFTIASIFNVAQAILFIRKLKTLSGSFREYLEKRKEDKVSGKGKKQKSLLISIKQKLLISFILIFLFIITVMGVLVLYDYKRTILNAVIANGKTLADQSASFYKENFTKKTAIQPYFMKEKSKNESYSLPYEALSLYEKQLSNNKYLITISTNEKLKGKELPAEFRNIEDLEVRYSEKQKTYRIVVPTIFNTEEGKKKIGFIVVEYAEDVIYESFFRSQVRLIIIGCVMLYISILLIYIIGGNIVFPILSLQIGVKKISTNLTAMLSGKERISADKLEYDEAIKTHDEIKTLSVEMDRMVNVIRGLIPYISESTFRQSEKQETKSSIRNLAFLFTDIRSFTTLCEGKSPKDVVDILNRYLEIQSQIIRKNGGDIDKFIGDAIMAVFAGQKKEFHACKASIELQQAMREEKEKRKTTSATSVDIGIGIHTGPAVFGSIGARERMDFTSIGDNVNLAARLEGANKAYETKTLISETVYNIIKDEFLCREIDSITVKGKFKPIKIYEILHETPGATSALKDLKTIFEKGLTAYRKQDWDKAQNLFQTMVKEFKDETSRIFISRIKHFKLTPPPANWDGVFNLTTK